MGEHFAAVDEWHAQVQEAVVLQREVQTDDERKIERPQNSLLTQRMTHLLASDDFILCQDFHSEETVGRFMFHEFLARKEIKMKK